MNRTIQLTLTLLLPLFVLGLWVPLAHADTLGTEDPVNGLVVQFPSGVPSSPPIFVASDGEATFVPFGLVGVSDVSDAIEFQAGPGAWVASTPGTGAFAPGFWTEQVVGNFDVWYLPATIPGCGAENEPTCEPIATWNFSGGPWAAGTSTSDQILESDGTQSDLLNALNNGPTGGATITFNSAIPEPSSVLLLVSVLGMLALIVSRRRRPA